MTGNKKVLCKVCYKEMRSDVLTRHMKVHETRGGSKREMTMNYSKNGLRVCHHEQKYFCSFCNFKTHKKYNLEVHEKNNAQVGGTRIVKQLAYSKHCISLKDKSTNFKASAIIAPPTATYASCFNVKTNYVILKKIDQFG